MAVSNLVLLRQHNLGAEYALQRKAQSLMQRIQAVQDQMDTLASQSFGFAAEGQAETPHQAKLRELGLDLFVFEQNGPKFWTTQSYTVHANAQGSDGLELQKHGHTYVMCWQRNSADQTAVYALPLIEVDEDGDSLRSRERNAERFDIVANPEQGSLPISLSGVPFFYLKIVEFRAPIHWDLVFLVGLLLLGTGAARLFANMGGAVMGRLLALFLYLTVEWAFRGETILPNLGNSAVFTPGFYSANAFDASLGLQLAHALQALLLIDALRLVVKWVREKDSRIAAALALLLVTALALCMGTYALKVVSQMVTLGQFSLDLTKLHLLEPLSFVALLVMVLLFLAVHWLLRLVVSLINSRQMALLALGMLALGFIAVASLLKESGSFVALWLLLLGVWGFLEWTRPGSKENGQAALRILVPCLVIGLHLNQQNEKREEALQYELICDMSLAEHDAPILELLNLQKSLPSDPGLISHFRYPSASRTEFEQRVRQIYLSGMESRFQLTVFEFTMWGEPLKGAAAYDAQTLGTLFHSPESKTVGESFKRLETKGLYGSFLGEFVVRDQRDSLGLLYLLLSPQMGDNTGRISEALKPSVLHHQIADYGYSSARYIQGRLSRQEGGFRYPISLFSGSRQPEVLLDSAMLGHAGEYRVSSGDESGFWSENQAFRHLVWLDENGNATVLSKPRDRMLENLSSFTLVALFGFLVLLAQYVYQASLRVWNRWAKWEESAADTAANGAPDSFLASRLRLSVTWLVFAIFVVVLIITIRFSSSNYTRRQREFLSSQAADISNTLQRQTNLNALFSRYETGILDELSEYYNTDINLYDTKGRLLASSNESPFREYHQGRLMNPEAFREFQQDRISACIKTEQLGELSYISAYTALQDKELNTVGYLNVPYFSNRSDLYRELSEYGSTLINLFAVVFALAAFVANALAQRISQPLNWIRQQMANLHLGGQHQALQWERNDEIGMLVTAYNSMLDQLDQSLNQLAASEREGAWREMAKQVAHEIKNPLTPMRLSLQHLQQSIRRGDENLTDKMQRTAALLIQQIDALSAMAEEFSSFAKMPDPVLDNHDLVQLLGDAVNLMEKEHSSPLQWTQPYEEMRVRVDAHQLGRVFNNLIKNAIQSIPEDRMGHIKVELSREGSVAQVRITDNGKGIADELKDKIFSPNFSTKNSGMGLGLAMTKKMVEQFGGQIWFRSELGQGTIFYVSLPLSSQ